MNKKYVTLYIATHNKTGLKYFGKTTRYHSTEELQSKYHGSGTRWLNHLKKHGDDVTMEIYKICSLNENDKDYVKPIAMSFSEQMNITGSYLWANIKPEDGLSGGSEKGRKLTLEHKLKISQAHKGKIGTMLGKCQSEKQKMRASETHKNKITSDETKNKISKIKKGKLFSEERKEKMRGKKIQKIVECPHCGKIGGKSGLTRYHFDHCKKLIQLIV